MIKALAIWTGLMVLLGVGLYLSVQDQDGAGIIVLAPMFLWIIGIVVILITGIVIEAGRFQEPGPPTVCTNCGSALYKQWWDRRKGGYDCRNCGQITAGRVVEESPPPAAD